MDKANWNDAKQAVEFDSMMRHKREMEMKACGLSSGACGSTEQTVGAFLDRKIDALCAQISSLQDLKASLPGSFLASPASRIGVLA